MANSSAGLHDKLGSLSKSDLLPNRKDILKEEILPKVVPEVCDAQAESLIQRCVIIQRDEKGYGLTVSGDNPVFVQSVKLDGAAARAGVQEGDRIIKVNGTLVTQSNHQEVVKLIKSGSYVALTLLGKSPGGQNSGGGGGGHSVTIIPAAAISMPGHGSFGISQSNNRLSSSSERITGPQPVDPEKQQEVTNTRIQTIKKMYDKEVIFLENLQAENVKNPSDAIQQKILSATKRVKVLEEQLITLNKIHSEHNAPRSPQSPPMSRHCHSENSRTHSMQGKQLTHQISAPTLAKSEQQQTYIGSPFPDDSRWPSSPASHPPPSKQTLLSNRNNSNNNNNINAAAKEGWSDFPAARQISVSTSCENLTKHGNAAAKTWPHIGPTHSRQSSSPEALLHNIRLAQPPSHQQNVQPPTLEGWTKHPEHSLTRSHSELGQQNQPRKMSASDALAEIESNVNASKRWRPSQNHGRSSSFRRFDRVPDSPTASPPRTPPPLTAFDFTNNSSVATDATENSQGIDVDEFCSQEETACFPIRYSLSMHDLSPYAHATAGRLNSTFETYSPILNHPVYNREFQHFTSTPESTTPLYTLQYGTPPEEQSSPTSSLNTQNISKLGQAPYIVCMEDDEVSSDSESHMEDHGPFKSLWKLLKNPAHLAVFMQYLLQNRNPASIFFYIIANHYEDGTGKEMKKWAYEIHSSFLVPGAPLRVDNIGETILREIDDVLQNHLEKEDLLRMLFKKAKEKSKETLNNLLAEFRNKRAIGLGSIYGPKDCLLEEAIHDKNKELRIIEQVIMPSVEKISDDPDTMSDDDVCLASSLATVLKQFGVKSPHALSFYDRWPSFVAKEKSRLKFLQRNKKSMSVQNHQFVPQHYCSATYCNHCQNLVWGVGNQGYQCQHCEMNIHKACVKVVEEFCIGAFRSKKDKRRDRMSGIMENIIGKSRKPSHPNVTAIEKAKKLNEEAQNHESNHLNDGTHITDSGDKQNSGSRVDKLRERFEAGLDDAIPLGIPPGVSDAIDRAQIGNKKGASIGRSESFRQRRESRPSFRKRSDPNIPRSKSDVEVDDKSNLNNSGSSSNSSLSARSLESPSNSQEMVHRTPSTLTAESISSNVTTSTTGVTSTQGHQNDDSDLEAETDPPNWQENMDWEALRLMKPKEKKRQDVINELFHTERTHVRNLKVLERMFFRPIQAEQLLPPEQLQLLFPNLEEVIEIHGRFNDHMKMQRKEEPVIGNIGENMLQMLDGHSGESLRKAAALFCKNQSIALECLKNKQKKDQKLALFLAEAEANNMCRRLQLKDIIVTGFQRLTKYPLLLENVAKYTTSNSEEHINLLKAVECSRQILAHVNQAVKEAENHHRLNELQKNLDKSSFSKTEHAIVNQYKLIDFTQHRLLYEGPLTWKLNKQKSIEVHVVLLEDILVLLLKQDEKFVLKFQNINIMTSKEDTKMPHSPILKVRNLFPRNVAIDKKGFFLVSASDQHAIYEFAAASAAERKIWLKHITDAIEAYKIPNGQGKIQEPNILTDRTESTEDNEDLDARLKETSIIPDENVESIENQVEIDSVVVVDGSPPEEPPTQPEVSVEEESSSTEKDPAGASSPPDPTSAIHGDKVCLPLKEQDESDNQSPQRIFPRVEILNVADGPQLIEPYEVVVRPSAVLQTAEPVLTPIEQLKRKDMQIASALAEKEKLVAKILQVPKEEFENIVEMTEEVEGEKDVQELLLAAIHQANRLSKLLNETLRVTEEDAISATSAEDVRNSPSPKINRKYGRLVGSTTSSLRSISSTLNKHLTQVLSMISSREQERKQLRKELHHSREQIHQMHEAHRYCSLHSRSSSSSNRSPSQQSRPNSFLSVASSTSEGTCELNVVAANSSDELMMINAPPGIASLLNSHETGLLEWSVLNSQESSARLLSSSSSSEVKPKEGLEEDDDEDDCGGAPGLTTSFTSDEGTMEMYVDAPATFPSSQPQLPEETGGNSACLVTDLDSDSGADEHPDPDEKNVKLSRNETSTPSLTLDSSVSPKNDANCAAANERQQAQQQSESQELVVNPIYF